MKQQASTSFTTPLTKPMGGPFLGNFTLSIVAYDYGESVPGEDRYGADIQSVTYATKDGFRWEGDLKGILEDLEQAGHVSILDDLREAANAHAQYYWESSREEAAAAHWNDAGFTFKNETK